MIAQDVAGVNNKSAGAISRNRLDVFFCLCPKALHKFAVVRKELVERLVLDTQWTSKTAVTN